MDARRAVIGVIGESRFSDPLREALAEEAGYLIASAGFTLVCGGLTGVMGAARRGGQVWWRTDRRPGTDRAQANPYVDVVIPAGMGQVRNAL